MNSEYPSSFHVPDPAAIFACALSLWESCKKQADELKVDLSGSYNGIDQLMRQIMRVANQFEIWSCRHIDFPELGCVWPYTLEDNFGEACLAKMGIDKIAQFNDAHCLRVALHLELPVILDDKLHIPLDLIVANATWDKCFCKYRIQTMRNFLKTNTVVPFVSGNEPFDDGFSKPYFGLYGIDADGRVEHIADRATYKEMRQLVQKIVPNADLPIRASFLSGR